tara:strand:+ start:69116 stop:69586 length:471 start_codon:yes stop_codon:yes gene_type:complete
MINNDVLRSIRYILKVSDQKLVDIVALSGGTVALADIIRMQKSEEDPDAIYCEDEIMAHFLDGLIYFKRGKDESKPPMPFEIPITNNTILKKLRVAFELKEDDIHSLIESANYKIGRPELSAFMRKKDHPNYRKCGDQVLRYFLKGLSLKLRGVTK